STRDSSPHLVSRYAARRLSCVRRRESKTSTTRQPGPSLSWVELSDATMRVLFDNATELCTVDLFVRRNPLSFITPVVPNVPGLRLEVVVNDICGFVLGHFPRIASSQDPYASHILF